MKKILGYSFIFAVILLLPLHVQAAETPENETNPFYTKLENNNSVDFDLTLQLGETENRLLERIKEHLDLDITNVYSADYFEILGKLADTTTFTVGYSKEEDIEFSEFAAIINNRINSQISKDTTDEQMKMIKVQKEQLLTMTYNDIKNQNKEILENISIKSADNRRKRRERKLASSFNINLATSYALKYALSGNPAYRTFGYDCTNFASQIAHAGGKPFSYELDANGMNWYYTNALAYSRSWTLAMNFIEYWTAHGGVSTDSTSQQDAANIASKGDFIGYWKKNTFEIGHISYVSDKHDGRTFISQHTGNRKNESFMSIDMSGWSAWTIMSI